MAIREAKNNNTTYTGGPKNKPLSLIIIKSY